MRFTPLRPLLAPALFILVVASGPTLPAQNATKPAAGEKAAPSVPAEFWNGLERHEIQLKQKLLVVKGSRGVVACPYLRLETFARMDEACAIIPAANVEGMLNSKVTAVTPAAQRLGIEVGMPGREALERIR